MAAPLPAEKSEDADAQRMYSVVELLSSLWNLAADTCMPPRGTPTEGHRAIKGPVMNLS